MARDPETQALIERLEASRRRLGGEIHALRSKLDVPARLKQGVGRHPWLWFGLSAAGGVTLSRLLRRPKRDRKTRGSGLLRRLLPMLFTLLKPWLTTLLAREIQRRFGSAATPPERGARLSGFPLSKS